MIDSCRRDPIKFNILYHNLSSDAINSETRSTEFGMIEHYNYGLSTNDQFDNQNENASTDDAYWKVLVDAAEQFFNSSIRELEKVSINRILEAFISDSIPSQSTKKSIPDSNAVLPTPTYGNEREDPIQ